MIEGGAGEAVGKAKRASHSRKRTWVRPATRKLRAGAAETAGAVSDDGVIGNS